jgi:hypothetical protein
MIVLTMLVASATFLARSLGPYYDEVAAATRAR